MESMMITNKNKKCRTFSLASTQLLILILLLELLLLLGAQWTTLVESFKYRINTPKTATFSPQKTMPFNWVGRNNDDDDDPTLSPILNRIRGGDQQDSNSQHNQQNIHEKKKRSKSKSKSSSSSSSTLSKSKRQRRHGSTKRNSSRNKDLSNSHLIDNSQQPETSKSKMTKSKRRNSNSTAPSTRRHTKKRSLPSHNHDLFEEGRNTVNTREAEVSPSSSFSPWYRRDTRPTTTTTAAARSSSSEPQQRHYQDRDKKRHKGIKGTARRKSKSKRKQRKRIPFDDNNFDVKENITSTIGSQNKPTTFLQEPLIKKKSSKTKNKTKKHKKKQQH